MKKPFLLLLTVSLLASIPVVAQNLTVGRPLPGNGTLVMNRPGEPGAPVLPRFDLDFPGGTPAQLIKAIEKTPGGHVNLVVSEENSDFHLPAVSVKNVTVSELFEAMSVASRKNVLSRGTLITV